MAGFTGINDITTAINSGKQSFIVPWSASFLGGVAGRWFNYLMQGGFPGVTLSGTGVGTQLTASTTGAFPLYEGNVSPAKRYLTKFQFGISTNNSVPLVLMLVDTLFYYDSLVVTGTPTTLDNTASLPRYTDGVGVMAACFVRTTLGAASPTLTFNCRADDDTDFNTTVIAPTTSLATTIGFVPGSAGATLLFFEIPAGKKGIKRINSYTIDLNGTTGTVTVFLFKPLFLTGKANKLYSTERELLTETIMPVEIKDGACLNLIYNTASTLSAGRCTALLEYVWN